MSFLHCLSRKLCLRTTPIDRKEERMPHVIVKPWSGKSEQQKARLADKIARDGMDVFNYGEESVSVKMA